LGALRDKKKEIKIENKDESLHPKRNRKKRKEMYFFFTKGYQLKKRNWTQRKGSRICTPNAMDARDKKESEHRHDRQMPSANRIRRWVSRVAIGSYGGESKSGVYVHK